MIYKNFLAKNDAIFTEKVGQCLQPMYNCCIFAPLFERKPQQMNARFYLHFVTCRT